MIHTVNSANINTSELAKLFQEPENKSIEKLAKLFKEEVKKTTISYLKRDKIDYTSPLIHANEVLVLVCELLNVSIYDVKSPCRLTELSEARFIFCFLLIKFSSIKISLANVGSIINRDHTTVLNAVKKTIEYNEIDVLFKKKLDKCIHQYTMHFNNIENFTAIFNYIPQY